MSGPPDEFEWIASLRPLARGDPRALSLLDDVAVVPARPDFDLVISKDAIVEGVHVLPGEAPEIIAKRLLRTALSDLAAKAAEPFGYLLLTAWPPDRDWAWRRAFAGGLAEDGALFGVNLLGGDTVSTTGPLTLSATVLGWVPAGGVVPRSGARAGDLAVVCGVIGDGWLGLRAAKGEVPDPSGRLSGHYRLPIPLFALRAPLRACAKAAADVSDGLLADAGRIAEASGLGLNIDIDRLPLSGEARAWLDAQPDRAAAALALATGGDDYALVCAVDPGDEAAFLRQVIARGSPAASVGRFGAGHTLLVSVAGEPISPTSLGWRH
ncbi:MAG: thiamine-phosphate kinase [Caulobacteraceae bacterium]